MTDANWIVLEIDDDFARPMGQSATRMSEDDARKLCDYFGKRFPAKNFGAFDLRVEFKKHSAGRLVSVKPQETKASNVVPMNNRRVK